MLLGRTYPTGKVHSEAKGLSSLDINRWRECESSLAVSLVFACPTCSQERRSAHHQTASSHTSRNLCVDLQPQFSFKKNI